MCNILLRGVCRRSLQSKQQELERQRATDSLKKGLERRPEKDELIGRTFASDNYVDSMLWFRKDNFE